MRSALISVCLLLAAAAAIAQAQTPGRAQSEGLRFEVTGEVVAYPDLAVITFAVVADGDTPAAAAEAAGKKQQAILAALTAKGVAAKDIAGDYLALAAVRARSASGGMPATGPGPVLGYQLVRGHKITLPITTPEVLTRVIDLASAAIAAGAEPPRWREGDTRMMQPAYESYQHQQVTPMELVQFTFKNQEEITSRAIASAAARARELADALAKTGGQKPGPMRSVTMRTEGYQERPTQQISSWTAWQPVRFRVPLTVAFDFPAGP